MLEKFLSLLVFFGTAKLVFQKIPKMYQLPVAAIVKDAAHVSPPL